MNYTKYGYRINQIKEESGFTWIFLPGGPGLGSEYLINFCQQLKLPGNILIVDFPKDGTNPEGILDFISWQEGLIDLLQSYPNPVLVTHSFSGMFCLNLPEIERHIAGLVLMNTTTLNSFFAHVSTMKEQFDLPDLIPPASEYHLNPSNESYKKFWNTYKYYCFTNEELAEGEKMLPLLAFNNAAYHYAIEHFYPDYRCRWQPEKIPAMTIASEKDYICPPDIFITDQRFQADNISNKLIKQAGHCPWLTQMPQIQDCFNEFLKRLCSASFHRTPSI